MVGALVALGSGCKKESQAQPEVAVAATNNSAPKTEPAKPASPALKLHWLGKKHLAADTNANYFVTIWNLPESARLQAQTLDKLSLWFAGLTNTSAPEPPAPTGTNAAANTSLGGPTNLDTIVAGNATASTLRPLLEDLVDSESYCELRAETNGSSEFTLAIRLDDQRASAWQAAQDAFKTAQTARRLPNGAITLKRAGAWTLFSIAPTNLPNAGATATEFASRIQSHPSGTPFTPAPTNYWLETDFDVQTLANAFCPAARSKGGTNSILASVPLPRIWLSVNGEEQSVRTRAELEFPQPLNLDLEPWNIPTNIIHDPLVSFTAIRGFRPWLQKLKPWQDLHLSSTPNQAYLWSMAGMPILDFAAMPVADATNAVGRLGAKLTEVANPWLAANKMGRWARSTNFDGFVWSGAPFISPQISSKVTTNGQFVLGGLMTPPEAGRPMPADLPEAVLSRTNLVFYDWELTALQADQLVYVGQLFRLISHAAQLPPNSASLLWLKKTISKFGNCVTVLSAEDSKRISAIRRSSIGLSSLELHFLADWLESPQFPAGLYTVLSPPPALPTNAKTVPNGSGLKK